MSAKKKTISRVLCLIMIVALIVPALLVVPVLAEVQKYSYNGVELPALPSYDKTEFPYAYIFSVRGSYVLRVTNAKGYYGGASVIASPPFVRTSWGFDGDLFVWTEPYTENIVSTSAIGIVLVWCNHDVYNEDGTLYMAGSFPVLIGGSNYPNSAETPTFTKNLTGATFYYMQGSTPEPLTVEAMVSDGGELFYEWFASDDVYQEALCTSNVFYPPTDTPGMVSYACKVTNRQYNPNADGGYFSSTAYSFSDTISVVASSTDPTTPEETNPDYSGKFDDLQNSMDEMPDKITDGMQDIMEQEKEQATQQGGQFVDDITGVVPNDSQGFIDALGSLVSVLSYDGTECVLPIPALTLPAIGGLFPSYTVMEAQEVDFEEFFALMPPAIMLLVQSLLTVALIVYCFKELYDTVAYFFVLKGGNK